jgi:E3 Ubiquitin ligase
VTRELSATILEATAPQFWSGVVVLFIAAGFFAWRALVQFDRKRLMENTPTSRIRSAAQGYVEFHGTVELIDGEPIRAALSGQVCVWYRYSVERKERTTNRRGQAETRWRTISRGTSEDLFQLRDATGVCVVDPDGALITPSVRIQWYGNTAQPPRVTEPKQLVRWLNLSMLGSTYRYTEERLGAGTPVYSLGLFRTHGGASAPAPLSAEITSLLREWKADQPALRQRFDANQDGEISAAEWDAARAAASDVIVQQTNQAGLPPAIDTIGDTHDPERPFVLSAVSEDNLAARATRHAFLLAALSVTAALLLGWSLIIRVANAA